MYRIALFTLAASFLFGAENACCPTPGTCSKYEGTGGRLIPAVPCLQNPCEPCGVVWTLDASMLAWQAREEGLTLAFNNSPAASSVPTTVNYNGSFVQMDFNWDPAVKVKLGVDFPKRCWDFDVQWTYFYTHSTKTATATPSSSSAGLFPLWALPSANIAAFPLYGNVHGSWQLHLNEFDAELGYNAFLTPSFSLRVDGGVKALVIDQIFRVAYSNGLTTGATTLLSAKAVMKNTAVGAGPRLGFESKWYLGRGFSLIGNTAGSLPLCEMKAKRYDNDIGVTSGVPQVVNSFFKETIWTFRPILETALGIGWDTCFGCRKQYAFGFQANYEFQYFWEQNLMPMLVNSTLMHLGFQPRGDLLLHGVTATFHFGY